MVGALGDVDYAAGFVDWFAILVYSVARPAGMSSVVTIWVLWNTVAVSGVLTQHPGVR